MKNLRTLEELENQIAQYFHLGHLHLTKEEVNLLCRQSTTEEQGRMWGLGFKLSDDGLKLQSNLNKKGFDITIVIGTTDGQYFQRLKIWKNKVTNQLSDDEATWRDKPSLEGYYFVIQYNSYKSDKQPAFARVMSEYITEKQIEDMENNSGDGFFIGHRINRFFGPIPADPKYKVEF